MRGAVGMNAELLSISTEGGATICLDGVRIDMVDEQQARQRILSGLAEGAGGIVVTVNIDHMVRCRRDTAYRSLVNRAELVVADGMPLVWASRLQGTALPERVAGSSVTLSLAADLAEQGRSLFLLGGNPGVAEAAGQVLAMRFSGLRIAGTYCPPFGFEQDPTEMHRIRQALAASRPDVVYVALGSPKQEWLVDHLRKQLPDLSTAWWLGIGISLSFISGEVHRAPWWLQRLGLEWGHRMVQEPRRLFRRYMIDGIPYVARLMIHCLAARYWLNRHYG
jgi:N-acetylglucosaminyldiphosphoundecaprenol N-acetyl-beta-D-mannosaminyltransferase